MTQLIQDVRHKLIHWSGGVVPSLQRAKSYGSNSFSEHGQGENDGGEEKEDDDDDDDDDDDEDFGPIPDPPQSIVEIMECAGMPVFILQAQQQQQQHQQQGEAHAESNRLHPRLTVEDCQEMALNASLRFLERILDTHHIELQEQQMVSKFNSSTNSRTAGSGFPDPSSLGDDGANGASTLNLVPTSVLDSILEVATLYTMSFVDNNKAPAESEGDAQEKSPDGTRERLAHFISTAFGNFLQHVRGELLEQAMFQQQQASQARAAAQKAQKNSQLKVGHKKSRSEDAAEGEEILRLAAAEEKAEEESDQYDEHIATAMATLLLSVRQLASALAMVPGCAISPDLASSFVDQTTGLTESMVRRRVDQKFYTLRMRVVEDCLVPFCHAMADLSNADEETKEDHPSPLLGAVQLASVALSDSLQLVDDTVRSILATLEEDDGRDKVEGEEADDNSMLREAVEQSTKRFAKWLASAMEMLAGYESSTDARLLLQPPVERPDDAGAEDAILRSASLYRETTPMAMNKAAAQNMRSDDVDEVTPDGADNLVETALLELLTSSRPTSVMVLAIAEMCRVAERSVMDNIHQSISTHGGGAPESNGSAGIGGTKGRKTATGTMGDGLFTGDESQKNSRTTKNPISGRYRLAASRVLSLFALNRGHEAGMLLSSTLPDLAYSVGGSQETNPLKGPRPVVCQVLELVKAASLDCADLFGGARRAGPIPENLEDEYASLTSSRMNNSTSNRSGLVFDVERMFAEKVTVYPHPSDVSDFHRNAVLVMIFKVAFKAWAENTRLLRFSVQGYRQIKVDVEFLKWFLPHFIKDETLSDGSNARTSLASVLAEVVQTAKERCVIDGEGLYQNVDETNQARATIRRYMSSQRGNPSFCINED